MRTKDSAERPPLLPWEKAGLRGRAWFLGPMAESEEPRAPGPVPPHLHPLPLGEEMAWHTTDADTQTPHHPQSYVWATASLRKGEVLDAECGTGRGGSPLPFVRGEEPCAESTIRGFTQS